MDFSHEPNYIPDTAEQIARFSARYAAVRAEIRKDIVGQEEVVDGVLIALIAGGNVLLEGVPGVGKTRLVRSVGKALSLPFSRIQFTPDLMPADVTGANIIEGRKRPERPAVRRRADLCEHRAGGRDQPRHPEDAVRPARGDAGAPRDGGRTDTGAG